MTHANVRAVCVAALALSAHAQTVSNLGIAETNFESSVVVGSHAAFVAREVSQGTDWSGDGSLDDDVLFVHDLATNTTTNVGLNQPAGDPRRFVLGDALLLVAVREFGFGPTFTDLNGDFDASDIVVFVHDLATGATTNLMRAVPDQPGLAYASTLGSYAVFPVSEAASGPQDWNGDGDFGDTVLHLYSATTAMVQNTGLAVVAPSDGRALSQSRRHAAFLVSESGSGADLNGDGDQIDNVVHLLDFATQAAANLGLAAQFVRGDGDLFIVGVDENARAGVDLTADGDANDIVPHLVIGATGAVRNLGHAVAPVATGRPQMEQSGYVTAWFSNESSVGTGADLNADGDANDTVVFTHHARANVTRNTGFAVRLQAGAPPLLACGIDHAAFLVSEAAQGAASSNGDGDAGDEVFHVVHALTGAIQNIGYAAELFAPRPFVMTRTHLAFLAAEFEQGSSDLNGDGGVGATLLGLVPLSGGPVTILPQPVWRVNAPGLAQSHLAFAVFESPVNGPNQDRNGDGDVADHVLHSVDLQSGVVVNHGIAVANIGATCAGSAAQFLTFAASEAAQSSTILNNDGDALDDVMHVLR